MSDQTNEFDDLFEQQLSDSLKAMPPIEVPSGFLPNVMFEVYETHHREKISLPLTGLIASILFLLSGGFFVWDVMDYAAQTNATSFGEALNQKFTTLLQGFDSVFSAFSGILSASWQIVSGTVKMFFTTTPVLLQVAIFIGLFSLAYLIRRSLKS